MEIIKKIRRFLASMPFAVGVLVLLAAACALSSAVPQGQSAAWYKERYGERTAAVILALHADDAYHSVWFSVLSGFLCLSLILCNVCRLPELIRRYWRQRTPEAILNDGVLRAEGVRDAGAVFLKMGIRPGKTETGDGREALFGVKHGAGVWGPWICHTGVLLLIAGFALGQMTAERHTVYGLPGQTVKMEGTRLAVTIDDFSASPLEDSSMIHYETALTVSNDEGASPESATVSVNHPAVLGGYSFFQNSTGWAATVTILQDGAVLQEEPLCAGDFIAVSGKPELVVLLRRIYPDLVMTAQGPASRSDEPGNPGYLYGVYYRGEMLGMNVLAGDEPLTIDEYTVTFSDPRRYTLLTARKDRFAPLALVGGMITLTGLILAFCMRPRSLWARQEEDGRWTVGGACRKGEVLFREELAEALEVAGEGKEMTQDG